MLSFQRLELHSEAEQQKTEPQTEVRDLSFLWKIISVRVLKFDEVCYILGTESVYDRQSKQVMYEEQHTFQKI